MVRSAVMAQTLLYAKSTSGMTRAELEQHRDALRAEMQALIDAGSCSSCTRNRYTRRIRDVERQITKAV